MWLRPPADRLLDRRTLRERKCSNELSITHRDECECHQSGSELVIPVVPVFAWDGPQ